VKALPSAEPSHLQTSVPVLLMSTTYNQMTIEQIETLSGLQFHRSSDIFWPTADDIHHDDIHHWNAFLQVSYTFQPLNSFKRLVGPEFKTTPLPKYFIFIFLNT
jgi:hypothetical protein